MSVNVTKDGMVFNSRGEQRKLYQDHAGYLRIKIDKKLNYVHRLVAKKFIPNPDSKPFVNHINGIRNDNRVENLEWVTHSENLKHGWGILKSFHSSYNKRKLSDEQKNEIIKKYVPRKYTCKMLSEEYGVSYFTIWGILNNKIYLNK
jgi:hypothetical protein